MAKIIHNISEVGMREIVKCPRCGEKVHPEYLRSDKEGYVHGCICLSAPKKV